MKNIRDLFRGRAAKRGSVMVETALIGSLFLIPLGLGAVDFGYILYTTTRLNTALEAATLYALGNSTTAPAAINQAAQSSYGNFGPALVAATPTTVCYCIELGDGVMTRTETSCNNNCTSPQQIATYVQMAYSVPLTLPVPIPGIPSVINLTANGMARIQ